jgi:hypothetical protein
MRNAIGSLDRVAIRVAFDHCPLAKDRARL